MVIIVIGIAQLQLSIREIKLARNFNLNKRLVNWRRGCVIKEICLEINVWLTGEEGALSRKFALK
jgi:hypothetical protein